MTVGRRCASPPSIRRLSGSSCSQRRSATALRSQTSLRKHCSCSALKMSEPDRGRRDGGSGRYRTRASRCASGRDMICSQPGGRGSLAIWRQEVFASRFRPPRPRSVAWASVRQRPLKRDRVRSVWSLPAAYCCPGLRDAPHDRQGPPRPPECRTPRRRGRRHRCRDE
jgi:hypothetical protein